jgi:hypothetical protein
MINNIDDTHEANCEVSTLYKIDIRRGDDMLQCLSARLRDSEGNVVPAYTLVPKIERYLPEKQAFYGELTLRKDLPTARRDAVFLRWRYNDQGIDGHFEPEPTTPKKANFTLTLNKQLWYV